MKDCIEVNHLNDSNIINKDEIQQLIEWLPKTPQKILKLYDTTEDAPNCGSFHQKCDNKRDTIVFVKSNKNCRFGGYASQPWDWRINNYIVDPNAFIFSLDRKKKYPVNIPEQALYSHIDYGPTFGRNHDFHISNYCTQNNGSYTKGKVYPLEEKHILNKGERNFYVKNYEVYHIIYLNNENK